MTETALTPGGLPHLLLRAACAVGLTGADLLGRVRRWAALAVGAKAHTVALGRMVQAGWLERAGKVGRAVLYALTAEGEAYLDDLEEELRRGEDHVAATETITENPKVVEKPHWRANPPAIHFPHRAADCYTPKQSAGRRVSDQREAPRFGRQTLSEGLGKTRLIEVVTAWGSGGIRLARSLRGYVCAVNVPRGVGLPQGRSGVPS